MVAAITPTLADLREADPDLAAVLAKTPPASHARILEVAAAQNPSVAALLGLDLAPAGGDEFGQNETGNARRFAKMFGRDFRFVPEAKAWYVWTGCHWEPDVCKAALAKTADVAEAIRAEALGMSGRGPEDRSGQEKALKWGNRSLSETVRENTLALAMCEPGMVARLAAFDADLPLVNVANGTIDLSTGQLRPHAREDLQSYCLPTPFDPAATCPRWERFLAEIFPNDPDLANFMQQATGYALSGTIAEQVVFVLWGGGANGKSVFVNVLRHVFGDLARHASIETFTARDGGRIPEDRARLRGARLVTTSESGKGQQLDESFIKDACGGEPITARFLHQNSFEFSPRFTLFMATNHKPTITGTDEGLWRRVRLVPFARFFKPEERDPRLFEALKAEAAGILAWAVKGCLAWQQSGLLSPAAVEEASQEYRAESDLVGQFIEEKCTVDRQLSGAAGAIYASYSAWAESGGFRPMNAKNFGIALREKGFTPAKGAGGVRVWRGLSCFEHA